jgi:hypothetical protein
MDEGSPSNHTVAPLAHVVYQGLVQRQSHIEAGPAVIWKKLPVKAPSDLASGSVLGPPHGADDVAEPQRLERISQVDGLVGQLAVGLLGSRAGRQVGLCDGSCATDAPWQAKCTIGYSGSRSRTVSGSLWARCSSAGPKASRAARSSCDVSRSRCGGGFVDMVTRSMLRRGAVVADRLALSRLKRNALNDDV